MFCVPTTAFFLYLFFQSISNYIRTFFLSLSRAQSNLMKWTTIPTLMCTKFQFDNSVEKSSNAGLENLIRISNNWEIMSVCGVVFSLFFWKHFEFALSMSFVFIIFEFIHWVMRPMNLEHHIFQHSTDLVFFSLFRSLIVWIFFLIHNS